MGRVLSILLISSLCSCRPPADPKGSDIVPPVEAIVIEMLNSRPAKWPGGTMVTIRKNGELSDVLGHQIGSAMFNDATDDPEVIHVFLAPELSTIERQKFDESVAKLKALLPKGHHFVIKLYVLDLIKD